MGPHLPKVADRRAKEPTCRIICANSSTEIGAIVRTLIVAYIKLLFFFGNAVKLDK